MLPPMPLFIEVELALALQYSKWQEPAYAHLRWGPLQSVGMRSLGLHTHTGLPKAKLSQSCKALATIMIVLVMQQLGDGD